MVAAKAIRVINLTHHFLWPNPAVKAMADKIAATKNQWVSNLLLSHSQGCQTKRLAAINKTQNGRLKRLSFDLAKARPINVKGQKTPKFLSSKIPISLKRFHL